jgi:hypothetical protein
MLSFGVRLRLSPLESGEMGGGRVRRWRREAEVEIEEEVREKSGKTFFSLVESEREILPGGRLRKATISSFRAQFPRPMDERRRRPLHARAK